MKILQGQDLMLFVNQNGEKKSIAAATNHTLTISAESKDISNKDLAAGEWTAQEYGLLSWTVSSENMAAIDPQGYSYEDLIDLMINKTEVECVFGGHTGTGDVPEGGWKPETGKGYSGKAIITNIQLNAPNGDNVTFTIDLSGKGALTKVSA